MNLENIINKSRIFIASTLASLALYSPAQEAVKLDTTSNGSWNGNSKATLYFQSMTGSQGRNLKQNPANQFETKVYFYGRTTPEGEVELAYATTDFEKPLLNASVPDDNNTRVYFFGDSDTTAEIVSQKVAMMNAKGEITFEETVPREKASSLLMKLGDRMLENVNDMVKERVERYSGGLLSIEMTEGLKNYIENQTKVTGQNAKKQTGYELTIHQINLQTRDNNFAIRNKEVGRITRIKFSSESSDKVPVSLFYHLALKRNGTKEFAIGSENEFGIKDAYTTPFLTSAKLNQSGNCSTANPLEGFWICNGDRTIMIISKEGNSFLIDPRYAKREIPFFSITKTTETGGELYRGWIQEDLSFKTERKIANFQMPDEDTIRVERTDGKFTDTFMLLTRLPGWSMKIKQTENNLSRQIETPKSQNSSENKIEPGMVILGKNVPEGNRKAIQQIGKFFGH